MFGFKSRAHRILEAERNELLQATRNMRDAHEANLQIILNLESAIKQLESENSLMEWYRNEKNSLEIKLAQCKRERAITEIESARLRTIPANWKEPNDLYVLGMPLNVLAQSVHEANRKWWFEDGLRKKRNKGELIALMHSELSEMLEAVRRSDNKNKFDDSYIPIPDKHLPHRSAEEVELVDLIIRALDYACAFSLDLDGAFKDKMEYNATRPDHSPEERAKEGGKKI